MNHVSVNTKENITENNYFPGYFTIEELSARWNVHKNTLNNQRKRGEGPEYIKRGRMLIYPEAKVLAYERR